MTNMTDRELVAALRDRAAKTADRQAAGYLRLAADRLDVTTTNRRGGRRGRVPDTR